MSPDDNDEWLDAFAYRVIRRCARQLLKARRIRRHEFDDVVQELALRLWCARLAFDSSRGHRYPFITTVVARDAAKIHRRRTRKKNSAKVTSLDRPVAPDNDSTWADLLDQTATWRQRCRSSHTPETLAELRCDVQNLLSNLPEDLQELAGRLTEQSISEISKETEIPRTTLYGPIRQIRRRFERSEMRDYL